MKFLDETYQRKALSNIVYWITLGLLGVYFVVYFIFGVDPKINITEFDSLVPVVLAAISGLGIVLNRNNRWELSRFLYLTTWLLLVNILPVIFLGVAPSSYVVHPILSIISSILVQLFFSFYRNRWVYLVFLAVAFLLTLFSFNFLSYYDTQGYYKILPLNRFQITTIFVMCWVFINLTLIYVYRIYWETYRNLQQKSDEIARLNTELELRVKQRTQQLQERNERLRAYAFMNAHIIRAPLSRILGLVNLLKNDNHDPKEEPTIREYLQKSARELDEVIRSTSADLENQSEEEDL